MSIKGVQFLSDARGNRTTVLIDLKRYRRIWEDMYDVMLAENRKHEARVTWEDVKPHTTAKWIRRRQSGPRP